jgi:hypothetical protein
MGAGWLGVVCRKEMVMREQIAWVVAVVVLAGVAFSNAAEVDHGPWDGLLAEHVSDEGGWVDYAGFKADEAALDAYLATLASAGLGVMGEDDRLATLINAYNAFTVKLILDHWQGGELRSIMDIADGKPWDLKRWELAGQTVSLNQLEHEMIRGVYDEPRIHWAVVCAAYSCPPLRDEAYVGDRLDEQLAEQEAYVLNFDRPRFAKQTAAGADVTRLFEWYGQDWDDPKAYVRDRLGLPRDAEIGYLDYSWVLNDLRNRP